MHAYRSSSLRSSTLTERKPEPTGVVVGPLMPTPLRLMEASVSSGNGLPDFSYSSMPASRRSQANSTPVASSTRRVASASSGPVPSPGMKVTSCGICLPFEVQVGGDAMRPWVSHDGFPLTSPAADLRDQDRRELLVVPRPVPRHLRALGLALDDAR